MAYLALGSNLGDRLGHLRAGLGGLRSAGEPASVSSVYATRAVGMGEAPDFLNAVVALRSRLGPDELLDLAHSLEARAGRERAPGEGWVSRTLDIDLLLYGDVVRGDARLTLPHPRLTERAFVLVPLSEIAPDLIVRGRTAAQWAAAADRSGVRLAHPAADWIRIGAPPDS